jgi:hypothetical protein
MRERSPEPIEGTAGILRRPVEADEEAWPDLAVPVEPSLPRLEPGDYVARSVSVDRFELHRWGRRLVVWFEIYSASPDRPGSTRLARLPSYFRLPDGRRALKPTAKLARLFDLLGPRPKRLDRLPLNQLRHRLWLVRVRDVQVCGERNDVATDRGGQRPLHQRQFYSVVAAVLEHLA